jgi:uncharacterized protein YajQ (UPF0234 family)
MPTFDIVSQVDEQELDNALNQTRKEIGQRFDFKDVRTEIEMEDKEIRITSDDDYRVKAVVDVLQSKLARRSVPLKALVYGKIEPASGGRAKQVITVQQGVDADRARQIVKWVKETKLKIQVQIQGDQLRVSGKKRDELQALIRMLKERDLDLPLQFVNFRE